MAIITKKSLVVGLAAITVIVSIFAASVKNCKAVSGRIPTSTLRNTAPKSKPSVPNVTTQKPNVDESEKYINLIGLTKEQLIRSLNEKPIKADEAGLKFLKAELTVWFYDNLDDFATHLGVRQIYVDKKGVGLNGVRLGKDKISALKKTLGNPVQEKNGTAVFKYKGIFLHISYDEKTEVTWNGFYILKNTYKL